MIESGLNLPSLSEHWDMLVGRPGGPLSMRLLIQPAVAAVIGIRMGLTDARSGSTPYGWRMLTRPHRRGELLREGWRHVRNVFLAALAIDLVYQVIAFRHIYVLQALLMAIFLAALPYFVFRSLTNRLARRLRRTSAGPTIGGETP
jgi:hypothetical protein